VTDEDGDVLLDECLERAEAVAFAVEHAGIVWAHGRASDVVGPCCWRVYT
jgi:hypothetical protein